MSLDTYTPLAYTWGVSFKLFMYPKGERDDLTPTQIKVLKQIVEQEYP